MDFEDIFPFLCVALGFFIIMMAAISSTDQTSDDEQACRDHGGTYVKVFDKDAYYCKGAR